MTGLRALVVGVLSGVLLAAGIAAAATHNVERQVHVTASAGDQDGSDGTDGEITSVKAF